MLSCDLPTEQISYKKNPVVFGYIDAGFNKINPIYLYWSNDFSTPHLNEGELSDLDYIEIGLYDTFTLSTNNLPNYNHTVTMIYDSSINGYIPNSPIDFTILPGSIWNLNITFSNYELNASTEIPKKINLHSTNSQIPWNCNGEAVDVSSDFNIELLDHDNAKELAYNFINSYNSDPPRNLSLESEIIQGLSSETISSITYDTRDCYTSSFASVPYFTIDLGIENENLVARYITAALEPHKDINQDGIYFPYEAAIFDTTLSADAFKGPMKEYQDVYSHYIINYIEQLGLNVSDVINHQVDFNFEDILSFEDVPYEWGWYREPIDTINLTGNIIDIMWLFFDYYGINMMIVQPMGEEYEKYYESDPDEFSLPYTLRQTNIESNQGEAYGLFYSTCSDLFFFNVEKEEETN